LSRKKIKAGRDIGACSVEVGQVYACRQRHVEIVEVDMGPLTKIGYQPVAVVKGLEADPKIHLQTWKIWLTWGGSSWIMPPAYTLT
jgi:hypothetical protein